MRFLLFVFALCAAPLAAHEFNVGNVEIIDPYTYPANGPAAAGYMTLINVGPPDRLMAVAVGGGIKSALYQTIVQDGVAQRRPVDGIDIDSDDMITLGPGGLHVLFVGLKDAWQAGDEFPAVLVFEYAGPVHVTFDVEPRP
ncbi:MAG: copper chaperone PCu(A)C [Pseudomonadota bacterium]